MSLRGKPVEARGDSTLIWIESWRGGNPGVDSAIDHREEPAVQALLPTTDQGQSIMQKGFSAKKTLILLAAIGGLIALSIGQASVGY